VKTSTHLLSGSSGKRFDASRTFRLSCTENSRQVSCFTSRAEIKGKRPTFLEIALTSKSPKPGETMIGHDLVHAVLVGGYPEMLRREDSRRRQAWARDYIKAIVQRDVRDIAEVEKPDQLPRLLQVLPHHSGQPTNFTQLGGQIGIDDKTTRRYVGILEQLFLVQRVSRGSAISLSGS
jgi:uncharacterized protein